MYPICSDLLRNYFSRITYIDDKFDTSLIDEPLSDNVDMGEVPVPDDVVVTKEGESLESYKIEGVSSGYENLCANLSQVILQIGTKKELDGIQLSPILYEKNIDESFLITKMQKAPLSIIDWNLGGGTTAFPIVSNLFNQSKQLKVVVVYTNSFLEAENAFTKDKSFSLYKKIQYNKKSIFCWQRENKSLLIIASKQQYNLQKLLESIIELYIKCCGLMPSAFLSVVDKINEMSGSLFGSFSKPFEDVYFLQLYFSELNVGDMPDSLTKFILSKVQAGIQVDPGILSEMRQLAQYRLVEVDSDSKCCDAINKSLVAIRPCLTEIQKEICDVLTKTPYDKYKDCFAKVRNQKRYDSWKNILAVFHPLINDSFKQVCNTHYEKIIQPYSDITISGDKKKLIEENKIKVIRKIKGNLLSEYDAFKKQIWPVCIQTLISGQDILNAGSELVSNLKYHFYSPDSLASLFPEGEIPSKEKRASLLKNQIHFGDILTKSTEDKDEYLLCITPPCDVFRPNKTELMVTFIKGKLIQSDKLDAQRKENLHVSVLPCKDKKGVKHLQYIEWRYFDLVKFDLKDDAACKKFFSYRRPYMLDAQYMRQIANKFTAYFSRAGVDEIFMKEEKSLIKMFI
jgi:hypothetical protein